MMITQEILEQMEQVRASGFANMFSRPEVMDAANSLECNELFIWLLNNKKHYAALLEAFQKHLQENSK